MKYSRSNGGGRREEEASKCQVTRDKIRRQSSVVFVEIGCQNIFKYVHKRSNIGFQVLHDILVLKVYHAETSYLDAHQGCRGAGAENGIVQLPLLVS